MSEQEVLRLELPSIVHVTGEDVKGEVHLDFRTLQRTPLEEVTVTFHGLLTTEVVYVQNKEVCTSRSAVDLIKESQSLWTKGLTYPAAGEHVLKLPFRFALPEDLRPSCQFDHAKRKGSVGYAVRVVGKRSGLHFNKTIVRPISVLPYYEQGALLRDSFRTAGYRATRSCTWEKKIRRGIWGEYSTVSVTLTRPSIELYPLFTMIPFSIRTTTMTKVMKRSDVSPDQYIFPAPPKTSDAFEFVLSRYAVLVGSDGFRAHCTEEAAALGGLGPQTTLEERRAVRSQVSQAVWVPLSDDEKVQEKQQRGTWKQESMFSSEFTLKCPPPFKHKNLSVKYWLTVKVPFPGIGNDFKGDLPIDVVSSFHAPGSGDWAGPPPNLDLPPNYYAPDRWVTKTKDDAEQ